jgi:hypothetical protein
MDLGCEAARLREEAQSSAFDLGPEKPWGVAFRATRYATAAEACNQAAQVLHHVLNTLTHELDDEQAGEALRSYA